MMGTRIQSALMRMGTQIIGVMEDADDLEYLAKHFLVYDPHWEKKRERVWMKIEPLPLLTWFGVSEFPQPQVIDHRLYEYSPEEQRLLMQQIFKFLNMGEFLVKVAQGEGNVRGILCKMSIAQLDPGLYPDEAYLAPARRLLAQRHGYSPAVLLEQIEARSLVGGAKKEIPAQQTPLPATMDDTTYVHPDSLPDAADPGDTLPTAHQAAIEEGEEFQ